MAKTATKIDPGRWYLAIDTVSLNDGALIRAGERRHGDDPLVANHPSWWVDEAATTPEQLGEQRTARQETAMRELLDSQPPPSEGYGTVRIVDPSANRKQIFVAVRETYGPDRSGAVERFQVGAQVEAGHPILEHAPDHFRPLGEVFGKWAA